MASHPNDYLLRDSSGSPIVDKPWIFRTYAGHTSAAASNALFRANLAAGQTGLSVAFDLPTQCGYSSDHPLALPEVGRVGVPINSIDDMALLFDGIPLAEMNTSLTINGTAMWLFALYVGVARERSIDESKLQGTTQNDIVKEYLARGTYVFPPDPSLRLIAEMYEYALARVPAWNPSNICSYHLQEAGATPEQEIAFSLSNAIGLLERIRSRGHVTGSDFEKVVGRISFFVNSGIRFIEEMCKMRAFAELWDEIARDRFAVSDPKLRRFRYGVQVNSLGLTEAQPENNAWRILLEALGVTLSRDARCRALQLPTWNEALSLPRAWDQQWSLRLQQILAYETDLLEYPDLFAGSPVIQAKTEALKQAARREISRVDASGGISAALESGSMKSALVRSMSERMGRIERGEQVVVGVNRWTESLPSPLMQGADGGVFRVDESATRATFEQLQRTKATRDAARVRSALERLRSAAERGENLVESSIECALARVTTGEWADALRAVFGEYRAATGVDGQRVSLSDADGSRVRARVDAYVTARGHRPRMLVAKPGLDGHSNGAEMVAVAGQTAGFEVIYAGIRQSPAQIAATAVQEAVDVIGISLLSGSHLALTRDIVNALAAAGANDIAIVVGGIVPQEDFPALRALGVADIFTPSDFKLSQVMERVLAVLEAR